MDLSQLINEIDDWNYQFNFLETIPVFCWENISNKYIDKKLDIKLFKKINEEVTLQLIDLLEIVTAIANNNSEKIKEYKENIWVKQDYFKEKPQDLFFKEKAKLNNSSFADLLLAKKMNMNKRINGLGAYLCYGLLFDYCNQGIVLNKEKAENITKDMYSRIYTGLEHADNIKFLASLMVHYNKQIGGL